jgi:hydroxyacylglutathione hydrolase
VPELGNRCHLVHDGRTALVVDPPRDPGLVERAADLAGVDIVAVADTHVHNDYVSGALALARRHGADYLLSADEAVRFERVGVRGGDVVPVGTLQVTVIDTPGHTRYHQAFHVRGADQPAVLLTGGSLLQGTVGRTDLVDDRLTRDLARAQWASARTLAALDPDTLLLPTHGFGSFCASTAVATTEGPVTLGDQLGSNAVLSLAHDEFVDELVAGFGPVPSYYQHMAPLNRTGAGRAPARPARRITGDQVRAELRRGTWVVDLRLRTEFADRHLPGTVSVEYSSQFATYVGWLVPWRHDVVLLADSATVLDAAVADLAGIGIEGVMAHRLRARDELTGTYRVAGWADYLEPADPSTGRVVIDVRQADEYAEGHLPGALHLPVQHVASAVAALPPGELWVHCRSGYRAGIAASVLHRAGRSVVHVDDAWERAGVALVTDDVDAVPVG